MTMGTSNGTSARLLGLAFAGALLCAPHAIAQSFMCEDRVKLDDDVMACYQQGPDAPPPVVAMPLPAPEPPKPDPLKLRWLKYTAIAAKHKLSGLASYYSRSLDGTLTANGEIYRNKRLTAAHLTLPLGCWIEVKSRATGRKLRLRVNDRGPYVSKFVLDLSVAAARALGVDVAEDRHVDIHIIAMPGEEPLPDTFDPSTAIASDANPATEAVATAAVR